MSGAQKTGWSFGFGTNTVRQKGARTAAQASGVGPQWVYFNYTTGMFEVDIVRVGKPNFTISGRDAAELKQNYEMGMSNTASSGIGMGANAARAAAQGTASAARAAASGVKSVAKGTAQRVAGIGSVLWSGKQALKGGRSRKNRKANRKNRTRRA